APLLVIDVNNQGHKAVESFRANVANNSNNHEKFQIPVHIAEFNDVADKIVIRPLLPRHGVADDRDMECINAVPLIEQTSTQQKDSSNPEVISARNAIKHVAHVLKILHEASPFLEVRKRLLTIENQELTISKP